MKSATEATSPFWSGQERSKTAVIGRLVVSVHPSTVQYERLLSSLVSIMLSPTAEYGSPGALYHRPFSPLGSYRQMKWRPTVTTGRASSGGGGIVRRCAQLQIPEPPAKPN